MSPFKWSHYPVNTTTPFRKRHLNALESDNWKKKKDQIFCVLWFAYRRGWDEHTFEPQILLCSYKLENNNFELSVPFKFCELHLKRDNSVLHTEKVWLTDNVLVFLVQTNTGESHHEEGSEQIFPFIQTSSPIFYISKCKRIFL